MMANGDETDNRPKQTELQRHKACFFLFSESRLNPSGPKLEDK